MEILDKLKLLAELKPGLTLSTTFMSILDHNSWTSAIWRSYYGEDRYKTLVTIGHIMEKAVEELKLTSESSEPSNLKIEIINALKGISLLKDTYYGDYYTMAIIDKIISHTFEAIKSIDIIRNDEAKMDPSDVVYLNSNDDVDNEEPLDNNAIETRPRIFKRRPRCRGM